MKTEKRGTQKLLFENINKSDTALSTIIKEVGMGEIKEERDQKRRDTFSISRKKTHMALEDQILYRH